MGGRRGARIRAGITSGKGLEDVIRVTGNLTLGSNSGYDVSMVWPELTGFSN